MAGNHRKGIEALFSKFISGLRNYLNSGLLLHLVEAGLAKNLTCEATGT